MSRTLPPGVNTVNECFSAFRMFAIWRNSGIAMRSRKT